MRMKRTVTLPVPLRRYLQLTPAGVNAAERTVEFSASSEFPVRRYDLWADQLFDEVLRHDAKSVDLARMQPESAAPFLFDHDTRQQRGVVVEAGLTPERTMRVRVKVSRSEEGDQLLRDMEDGIRPNISIGYDVREAEIDETREVPLVVATDWQPLEVSSVALPADPTVGLGRTEDTPAQPSVGEPDPEQSLLSYFRRKHKMRMKRNGAATPQNPPTPPEVTRVDVTGERDAARREEQARCRDIMAIGERFKLRAEAQTAIGEGTSAADFQSLALDAIEKRSKAAERPTAVVPAAEMDRHFSVGRAVLAIANDNPKSAPFEMEVANAYREAGFLSKPGSILIPWRYLLSAKQLRDITKAGTGSNLIATEHLDSEYIEHLLSDLVVMRAGTRLLSGLVGDIDIPVGDGAVANSGHFNSESADASELTPAFTQRSMSPKTGGAFVDISRKMRLQSAPAIEAIVREYLRNSLLELIERTAISSTGSATVPQGIIGTSGLTDNGGAFDSGFAYSDFLALGDALFTAKAGVRSMSMIANRAVRSKALSTERFGTGSGNPIGRVVDRVTIEVDGDPLYCTQEFPADPDGSPTTVNNNGLIAGDFSRFLLGIWGPGIEISVDDISLNLRGGRRLISLIDYDLLVSKPEAFTTALAIDVS